jgi:hypothetical protein
MRNAAVLAGEGDGRLSPERKKGAPEAELLPSSSTTRSALGSAIRPGA